VQVHKDEILEEDVVCEYGVFGVVIRWELVNANHKVLYNTAAHPVNSRDLTILGRQRDGNGYQYNKSLKRME
jgi:hypothetical protein